MEFDITGGLHREGAYLIFRFGGERLIIQRILEGDLLESGAY